MKRKSALILIAALVLSVSIPVFAFAANDTGVQVLDGTGNMFGSRGNGAAVATAAEDVTDAFGNQYALANGYRVNEDGYCYYLDAQGEQQFLYTRAANGQFAALRSEDGVLCRVLDDDADTALYMNRRTTDDDTATLMNRRMSDDTTSTGGRGGRWN